MKNIMKKVLLMLLALFLFLPTFSSVAVLAKADDEELTPDEIWELRDPAYMNAGFSSLEERIKALEG